MRWLAAAALALLLVDQALNLAGAPHAIHLGGYWRGETALFDLPETWQWSW